MEKENLEELFKDLEGHFDSLEPKLGHEQRFLTKLNEPKKTVSVRKPHVIWWKPLSIAASLALLVALIYGQLDLIPQWPTNGHYIG